MMHTTLSEIAIELEIKKSKLAYYCAMGLLTPIAKMGRMNIFDRTATLAVLRKIGVQKKKSETLKKMNSRKTLR